MLVESTCEMPVSDTKMSILAHLSLICATNRAFFVQMLAYLNNKLYFCIQNLHEIKLLTSKKKSYV